MTADGLRAALADHNPIERLAPLAKAGVPDPSPPRTLTRWCRLRTIPLQMLADRYRALGGPVTPRAVPGRACHDMRTGWFEDRERLISRDRIARRGVPAQPRAGSATSAVR
ncbi:MAG: hypothetical protein U1F87_11070 [Kiritimatiellia bacterium]